MPGARIVHIVQTKFCWHVVAVILVSKEGELDRVLDEHRMLLRAGDERSRLAKWKLIILYGTPRLNLTDTDVSVLLALVCGDT